MGHDPDEARIRQKAHALWEAEGHPHGRDQDHWEQAREMVAIEDSQKSTLLPRDTGAEEPIEDRQIAASYGDVPNLTDQGADALTDISREPSFAGDAKPAAAKARKAAKDVGPPDALKPAKTPKIIDKTAQTASMVAGTAKASSRKPSSSKIN